MQHIIKYVLGEASKSNSTKRQVGCVIVGIDKEDEEVILAKGHNIEFEHSDECVTHKVVGLLCNCGAAEQTVHAEAMACDQLQSQDCRGFQVIKAYVSHQPCPECAMTLLRSGIDDVEVVEPFMKFDGDKLRYDLLPPQPLEDLVAVLTQGARKYKPNNWRECNDLDRYIGALFRHIEAHRKGELRDKETGLPHLAHAMCNLVFLLELGVYPNDN